MTATTRPAPAPRPGSPPSPCPPPRVAVVGCGYWGKNLVRNYHELGALAAVADADPGRARGYAEAAGVAALGFEEALADPGIAAVVIATPAEMHAAMTARALEAGKHVFVEKPLALRVADGEALAARAEAAGRVLMVGHLLQYHPAFLRLRALVAEGRLGRLRYVYSNRLNLGKVRREENVFWSFAPHDISMILAIVGEAPSSVLATGASYLHSPVADITTTHFEFPSGVNAHVFVSWLHPFKDQKLVVVGDRCMAVFDDCQPWDAKLSLYPHEVVWQNGVPELTKRAGQPIAVEAEEPLRLECAHFLGCVARDERPRTDAAEGLAVLRLLDAAQRSMESHEPIFL